MSRLRLSSGQTARLLGRPRRPGVTYQVVFSQMPVGRGFLECEYSDYERVLLEPWEEEVRDLSFTGTVYAVALIPEGEEWPDTVLAL